MISRLAWTVFLDHAHGCELLRKRFRTMGRDASEFSPHTRHAHPLNRTADTSARPTTAIPDSPMSQIVALSTATKVVQGHKVAGTATAMDRCALTYPRVNWNHTRQNRLFCPPV